MTATDHTKPAAEADNADRAKENRENAVKRIAASGVGVEKVQADPTYGWTAQQGPAPATPDAIPGQVFVPRQLPDPEVQKAWGVDPTSHAAGLEVVNDDVGLQHPGGPEADEAHRLGLVGSAYHDTTPDARVASWLGGRDEEYKTDLAEEVEQEEAQRNKEEDKKVDTEGLSPAQAHAVQTNQPSEDTGAVSEDAKKSAKKTESDKNASKRGRTPSEAGSQTNSSQGTK